MQVEIRGLQEAIDNLGRIDQELRHMEPAMSQATLLVSGAARKNAPVDVNRLRDSIMPSVTSRGGETVGVVGSNVSYAPFMELGTRPHWPPIAALELWARRHGTTAYVVARAIARRGTKPRYYLRRALEDNHDRIIRIFNEAVARIVK